MKTFSAGLAAALARKAGIAPAWILKLTTGGVDYYLSDSAFDIPGWNGGISTLPWVATWGQVQEGLSGELGEIRVADMSVALIIDPDATPNMEDLAEAPDIEQAPASLFLWVHGLDPAVDPPHEIARFHVRDVSIPDETLVTLELEDETLRLRGFVGARITRADYPDADPDDVGKVVPMVFGSVRRLPALAVDAGIQTSLPININETVTTFALSDGYGWSVGKAFQIDEEQFLITAIDGDNVTVERGHSTTIPAGHLKGAVAWELKNEFSYLIADHAVDAIPKVRGVVGQAEVDVTAVTSRYLGAGTIALVGTGQVGGQHPGYPGRACITLPGYITIAQAVQLWVNDGISIEDTITILNNLGILDTIDVGNTLSVEDLLTILDGIGVSDTISISDTILVTDNISVAGQSHAHPGSITVMLCPLDEITAPSGSWLTPADYAIDNNLQTGGVVESHTSYGPTYFKRTMPFVQGGYPRRYRFAIRTGDPVYTAAARINQQFSVGGGSTPRVDYLSWVNISSWSELNTASIAVQGQGNRCKVWEVWIEVEYDTGTLPETANVSKFGSAYKSGGVSKSGNATKSGTVSRSGSVGLAGDVAKTGDVSLTGDITGSGNIVKNGTVTLAGNSTANTLVGDALLCDVQRAMTVTDVFDELMTLKGYGPVQMIGSLPQGYAIDGAITEYRPLLEWLDLLAFQCRCYFRMHLGQGRILVRPDALQSAKTIPAVRLVEGRKAHARRKVGYAEIINRINLLYDRDWSITAGGDNAYRGLVTATDQDSVDIYGAAERPEMFQFDFVRDPDMAASLAAFYLAQHKDRQWLHELQVFLDHSDLEFADAVTLGFSANQVGEIQQVRFTPGDTEQMDMIELVVKSP